MPVISKYDKFFNKDKVNNKYICSIQIGTKICGDEIILVLYCKYIYIYFIIFKKFLINKLKPIVTSLFCSYFIS